MLGETEGGVAAGSRKYSRREERHRAAVEDSDGLEVTVPALSGSEEPVPMLGISSTSQGPATSSSPAVGGSSSSPMQARKERVKMDDGDDGYL